MKSFDPYGDDDVVTTLTDLLPQDSSLEHDFDVYSDFCVRCRRSYEEIIERDLQFCDEGKRQRRLP